MIFKLFIQNTGYFHLSALTRPLQMSRHWVPGFALIATLKEMVPRNYRHLSANRSESFIKFYDKETKKNCYFLKLILILNI